MINVDKIYKTYGYINYNIIEYPSSGDDRGLEDEEEHRDYSPSFNEICEKLIDFQTIMELVKIILISIEKG